MPKKTFFNLPQEKRERITQVLIKYFAHKPYSKVDIEDVAKESQVSKGSMYQYFENKKDMYFYTIKEVLSKYLKIVKDYDFASISLFDYTKKAFEYAWDFLLTYPDEYLLMEKTAFYDDSPFKKEIEEFYHSTTRVFLEEIITKNQKSGFIRDDVPPKIVMVFLEGSVWDFKKALLEMAKKKGVKLTDLPKDYVTKVQDDFMKLIKEGIGTKK